jgi:hypothetical protein
MAVGGVIGQLVSRANQRPSVTEPIANPANPNRTPRRSAEVSANSPRGLDH